MPEVLLGKIAEERRTGKYTFGDIAINSTEKKKPEPSDKAVYIGLEHLDSGSLTVRRFGADVAPIGDKLVMKKGDVLFGKRRAYQKKVAIAPFDGIFSAHGMVLRPKTDVIDKDFFPLFIASDYFLDAAIKISVGSLSPTINWSDLKQLEFSLPPLDEQKSLAKVLWSAMELKEAYQKLLARCDELAKSRFIEMFGDLEKEQPRWPVVNIGDLFDVGSSKRVFQKDWKNAGVPFYRAREIVKLAANGFVNNELFISEEMYGEYARLYGIPKQGDILVTGVGTLGVCYLVKHDDRFYYKDGNIICLHSREKISSRFVCECYKLPFVKKQIQTNAGGSTVGTYTIENARKTRIIVPPYDLQNSFIAFVEQLDKSKVLLQECIANTDSIIKNLLNQNG